MFVNYSTDFWVYFILGNDMVRWEFACMFASLGNWCSHNISPECHLTRFTRPTEHNVLDKHCHMSVPKNNEWVQPVVVSLTASDMLDVSHFLSHMLQIPSECHFVPLRFTKCTQSTVKQSAVAHQCHPDGPERNSSHTAQSPQSLVQELQSYGSRCSDVFLPLSWSALRQVKHLSGVKQPLEFGHQLGPLKTETTTPRKWNQWGASLISGFLVTS